MKKGVQIIPVVVIIGLALLVVGGIFSIYSKSITGNVVVSQGNDWCGQTDFNNDGIVDLQDFGLLKMNYGVGCADILVGDMNKDCIVNETDWRILQMQYYGMRDCSVDNGWCGGGDLNRDSVVDLQDFSIVKGNNGSVCNSDNLIGDANKDCTVDLQDFSLLKARYGDSDCSGANVIPDEVNIYPTASDTTYSMNFIDAYGNNETLIPIVRGNSTGLYPGADDDRLLVLDSGNVITKNDYFVLSTANPNNFSSGAKSFVVQYKGADSISGDSPILKLRVLGESSDRELAMNRYSFTIANLSLGGTNFSFTNKSICSFPNCNIALIGNDYHSGVSGVNMTNSIRTKSNVLVRIILGYQSSVSEVLDDPKFGAGSYSGMMYLGIRSSGGLFGWVYSSSGIAGVNDPLGSNRTLYKNPSGVVLEILNSSVPTANLGVPSVLTPVIACYANSDCGTDSANYYCSGSSSCSSSTTYTCTNPGTVSSVCSVAGGGGCGVCSNGCNSTSGLCKSGNSSGNVSVDSCVDYGDDFFKKDNVTIFKKSGEVYVSEDQCMLDGRVQEQTCCDCVNYVGCKNFCAKYLNCTYGCSNGACLSAPVIGNCTDTDGGKNYTVQGSVFVNGTLSGGDYCVSGTLNKTLKEYYCVSPSRGYSDYVYYNCSVGNCSSGKCLA